MRASAHTLLALLIVPLFGLPSAASAQSDKPAPAQAKAGAQIRVDSVGSNTQTGSAPAQVTDGFVLTTARLGLTGELSDEISYVVRLNLRSVTNFSPTFNPSLRSPDGGLNALDRAYIEHRVLPNLSLKIGRMPSFTGSIETDYSSIDEYYYSYVNGAVVAITPITTVVDVTYSFAGQSLTAEVFDGFYDGNVQANGPQTGANRSVALGYRGSFAGGMIKPIVSYDLLSRIRNGSGDTVDEKATYTAYAAGTVVSFAGVDVDLEYDALLRPKFDSTILDASNAVARTRNFERKTTGVIGQVAYSIIPSHLRAFFKASADKELTDGKETYNAARNALGVEFRPSVKAFRYHAVMVNTHDDAGKVNAAGDVDKTRTNGRQYIVGMAAKI